MQTSWSLVSLGSERLQHSGGFLEVKGHCNVSPALSVH